MSKFSFVPLFLFVLPVIRSVHWVILGSVSTFYLPLFVFIQISLDHMKL